MSAGVMMKGNGKDHSPIIIQQPQGPKRLLAVIIPATTWLADMVKGPPGRGHVLESTPIPVDAELFGVVLMPHEGCLKLIFEHPSFEPILPNQQVPISQHDLTFYAIDTEVVNADTDGKPTSVTFQKADQSSEDDHETEGHNPNAGGG